MDERKRRVTREELRRDPASVVKQAATGGPLFVVDERGKTRAYISVPQDPRPMVFED